MVNKWLNFYKKKYILNKNTEELFIIYTKMIYTAPDADFFLQMIDKLLQHPQKKKLMNEQINKWTGQ